MAIGDKEVNEIGADEAGPASEENAHDMIGLSKTYAETLDCKINGL